MIILFLSRLFYPHIGGVEKHVLKLSQELIKKGHRIIVITENHGWKDKEIIDGINVIRINVGKREKLKKFFIWKELWKYRSLMYNADIIHCHDVLFWYLPFGYLHPIKPVFTTFHGYEGNTIPGIKAVMMHKLAEFSSNRTISIGSFLDKWYHTHSTIISYGATDTPQKIEIKKTGKNPTFLYIGRLEEEVGILEYIKALGLLKQKGITSKLIVLGDGTQRQEAESMAKKYNLDTNFQGFVEDINSYFSKADYVFVSRYLGILEAFANKKFVFATYNNQIKKDYLTLTPFSSWISITPDAKILADSIEDILKNTKTRKVSINDAFQWVTKQSWKNLTEKYLALWDSK